MATAVISARVPESVKARVDAVIREAGTTQAEVINGVWRTIAETGELPEDPERGARLEGQRARFRAFMKWRESLPPIDPEFADMSDEELLAMKAEKYV